MANEPDFRMLTQNSVDIICRIGVDLVLHYVSPASFRILGWTPAEMTGRIIDKFIFAEDLPIVAAAAAAVGEQVTVRMLRKDGSTVWMENRATVMRDPVTNEPEEWVVTMRDISERKQLEEELSSLALTDGLTGLANRRAFDEALYREWKRTTREGLQISLVLLDIDYFKEFNDRYGHQVGDDCLRAVAAAVQSVVRDSDTIARYGGEEITVILPSTDSSGAVAIAEKLRVSVESLNLTHEGAGGGPGYITVSVGVATALARHGGTMKMPESLLLAADTALYKAKAAGRNAVATAILVAAKTD